jgi:hypothetical protein
MIALLFRRTIRANCFDNKGGTPMKRLLSAALFLALAAPGLAQRVEDLNGRHVQFYPPNNHVPGGAGPGGGGGQNISFHGGPVMTGNVNIVAIFWGPSWSGLPDSSVQSQITGFFQNFGNTGEYKVITQYYDKNFINISSGTLATTALNDNTAPLTNVTDSAVQAEVSRYITNQQHGNASTSTIYEVFLPPGSYASYGTADSCGGPNLQFCAYHSNFNYNGVNVKYSSMPYPSCSGCKWTGWTDAQNLDHFACHETREAVTDPDGTAWYDGRGYEADDKCAWSPAPFIDGTYGYQYEWSNASRGCVQKMP